jgi:hypothetical protein
MPRKQDPTIQELIEALEDPQTTEFDSLIYTRQAVILLLKEVNGIKDKENERSGTAPTSNQ